MTNDDKKTGEGDAVKVNTEKGNSGNGNSGNGDSGKGYPTNSNKDVTKWEEVKTTMPLQQEEGTPVA